MQVLLTPVSAAVTQSPQVRLADEHSVPSLEVDGRRGSDRAAAF